MSYWLRQFQVEDEGQDIIEYSLLICFIAIACMWFLGQGHSSVVGIWTAANSQVTNAHSAATN